MAGWDDPAGRIRELEADLHRLREGIAKAIESERSRRWQKHLADHPHSDASSCPYDYGEHDGMYAAATIARSFR